VSSTADLRRGLSALYELEAARCYRLALLVLGDAEAATRAVEATFLELAACFDFTSESLVHPATLLGAMHRALARHEPPDVTGSSAHGGALPFLERQALAYCLHGRVTVSEVAALLGEHASAVHARLGRALRSLALARAVY
jgi:DNA-directed RNA polymerase specialized sigma24 family protein